MEDENSILSEVFTNDWDFVFYITDFDKVNATPWSAFLKRQ
jgi:hypothetical protein